MYKPDIFDGIVKILTNSQNIQDGLTYTVLYNQLVINVGWKVSRRDYSYHLAKMVEEKILGTKGIKDKRKFKYYFLTDYAKRMYELKILGIDKEHEKRLEIYHLIIYFETFKRGRILTRGQVHKLLKRIGTSWEKLQKIDNQYLNNVLSFQAAYEEPVTEIEILELPPGKIAVQSKKPSYYVLMRGLSVTEFLSYMKKLRNGKEPKPFSQYPVIVPFVASIEFTDKEVEEAIELLEKADILKPIENTMNKKDTRFRVADKRLINLIHQMRIIAAVYIQKVIMKVAFIDRPDDEEKQVMAYFYGKERASHFLTYLNDRRKEYLKTVTKQRLQKRERFIGNLSNLMESLFEACAKENEEIIKDELLGKLCLPFKFTEERFKST
jgi:hypothetical protein